jgi:exodeoxyribonuclease V alpha subunit
VTPAVSAGATDPLTAVGPLAPGRDADPFDARLAGRASGLLREFNRAGVISAADVHVARQLAALSGETDERVLLAVALAVRAPRLGHVHLDLGRIRETAAVDAEEPVDLTALPWPEPRAWVAAVGASTLVAAEGENAAETAGASPGAAAQAAARPLRQTGTWLYLDRYWAEEVQVAAALLAMAAPAPQAVDAARLSDGLRRLFPGERGGRQELAAAAAVLRRFAVVAGGPGTGKTTTVARIAALLCEQAAARGEGPPLIALAAPTGKAAARLQAAVNQAAAGLNSSPAVLEQLRTLPATTLHRLLGWRPDSSSRFRHHRHRRLPHDVVIVDETSMVSLSLMARLIEALRSDARLILVGDPGQLASIEAGAVLGDIVGPAADVPQFSPAAAAELSGVTGATVTPVSTARAPSQTGGVADGIVILDRGHRFGEGIAQLATAIRSGDDDAVIALLRSPPPGVRWLETDVAQDGELHPVRDALRIAALSMVTAAQAGRAAQALEALASFRILCAHRRGPYGVSSWTARAEAWLENELPLAAGSEQWYVGRPLLVTENDYELGLNNGDTGVVVQTEDRVLAAFARGEEIVRYSPTRLSGIETVYAMTIHKSQGSQFDVAAVLLPEAGSRILTRELLYTAATRARRELILAGPEDAVRAAVRRPVARASGLRRRLWADSG